jgi:ABC-type multidrug transport system fused ATPase/permease subunit
MSPSPEESTKDVEANNIESDTGAAASPAHARANELSKNDEKAASSPPPSLAKLLSIGKPEWPVLAVALILMVGAEATGLYNPLVIGKAYNYLVDQSLDNPMKEINRVMITVLVIHFTGVAAAFVRTAMMGAAGERIVSRLRNNLYSSILRQEIAFFDSTKTGELVSRLGSDTTLIQGATSNAIPEVILGITKVIFCMALMFWISPKLAGVTLGSTFLLFSLCIPFGNIIGALSRQYQDALGEAQTYSTESLGAMRTVQSFAAEDRERQRYANKIGEPDLFPSWWPVDHKEHKTTYSVGFFKSIWNSGFFTFIFGFGFGSMYVSLWYGFKLVSEGEMTLGDLTAFQSYIFQIGSSLAQTSRYISQVIEARGASGRIFDLLERIPNIPAPPANANEPPKPTVQLSSMEGHVQFNNITFAYPTRPDVPVLRDFSLSIPANSSAALVGSSGAGKSTVVSLLQRFYDVSGGSITIDGVDIRDMDLKWMRQHIGYVQQEPQLFGLSIRENVCYGVDGDVSEEDMMEACRKANAHEFIMTWPLGYDTLVGERGVKLSGGQKQRIAIARSILVNPRILLLDEATSALDAESEHLVQEAIDNAAVGRTVLIVAHRLSTIRRANQIVVVDDHKLEDVGTHDELLARCSKYQDLIKRQSAVSM